MAKKKKRPASRSSAGSIFKIAARSAGYKAAKKAEAKAATRKKKAWKSALVKARKAVRSRRRR